jgi:hypothetical protein
LKISGKKQHFLPTSEERLIIFKNLGSRCCAYAFRKEIGT